MADSEKEMKCEIILPLFSNSNFSLIIFVDAPPACFYAKWKNCDIFSYWNLFNLFSCLRTPVTNNRNWNHNLTRNIQFATIPQCLLNWKSDVSIDLFRLIQAYFSALKFETNIIQRIVNFFFQIKTG